MGFFTSEFGHSSPNPDSCCLATLTILLLALSLFIGAIVGAVWFVAS